MPKGTRSIWMAALLALAMGAGELVAYQGLAPHAQALLSGGRSGAAIAAGQIVARDLSVLMSSRLHAAAGDLALLGVRQTSRLYRLAQRALGAADPAAQASDLGGADPGCDAAVASEPDMPCLAPGGCEASRGAELDCPPCPACPIGSPCPARAPAPNRPASPGRTGA